MKENLIEINERGLAQQYPVILGGAALTRGYVEEDLAGIYPGIVRYAKDAFEGLSLMDAIMNVKRGVAGAELPELRKRTFTKQEKSLTDLPIDTKRSEISTNNKIPKPPFWGSRVVKGIALNEVSSWLDERATFMGQWGLKSSRIDGPSYEELIESEGRPRLRYWLDRIATEGLNELAVVYGYFPAYSEGNTIVILDPETQDERARFTFPRQTGERRLCLADYVKPKSDHEQDFVAFHVATMGNAVSKFAAKLFEANSYREYLELHGLSVQLTEALAEMWHARVRAELGLSGLDGGSLESILKQDYQGERFSFGYPACPDLELQLPLTQLLEPQRIGVELSEEFQLHPEQSTSAIIFHHPDAAYFNAR
jgi:5-methyltetrahydrofolate--homocysteine methyltransferase